MQRPGVRYGRRNLGLNGGPAWLPSSLSGLVLWLRADLGVTTPGGQVSAWADQSGNANNAAGPAGIRPTHVVADPDGLPSVDFDGNDDRITVTDHATISPTAAWTMGGWYRADGSGTIMHLFSTWHTAGQYRYLIRCVASGTLECYISDNIVAATGGTGFKSSWLSVGAWQHLAIVFNGAGAGNSTRLILYINGVATAFTSISGTIPAVNPDSTATLVIGTEGPSAGVQSFNGAMDDLFMYNRALTAAEVLRLATYRTRV